MAMGNNVKNPWGLSLGEVDTMDLLIVNANQKVIAARRGVGKSTVSNHVTGVLHKMHERHIVQAAIKWSEWRKGDGQGVPA